MFIELLAFSTIGFGALKILKHIGDKNEAKVAEEKFRVRLEALGISDFEAMVHEGGHPEVPIGVVLAWPEADGICFAGLEDGPAVKLLFDKISSVDVRRRAHTETSGAVYQGVRLGHVGMGRRINQSIHVDESTTEITFKHGRIKAKMVLQGGQETYAKIMPMMANAEAAVG